MIVVPSELSRLNSSMISRPWLECRLPVGSSARIRFGFAITARLLWLAPVILVVLAAEYHAIVRWEEQMLESRLGEGYSDYVSRVPRWVPSHVAPSRVAVSAPSAASARRFSWRQTLFSERGTLIAIAAGYLLLWTKARF